MRKITLLLFLLVVLFPFPAISAPESAKALAVESEQAPILLTINGNNVRVQNAVGTSLFVYNVLGQKVNTFKIESADETFTINLPKGWYILKIDNITRKIALK